MFLAAFISFMSMALLMTHMAPRTMRRLVGYKGWVDVTLHCTILFMFLGTSTMGLLQAEAAGILFSLYLRVYSWAFGFERYSNWKWQRFAGRFT